LDFRSVSIGSARLQSLLWQLEEFEPRIPLRTELSQANMLVVVPEACQHTLGATVLAGQLRRMGRGVKLELATSPNALKGIMDTADFAGVMISASSREPLASLADLVQTARQSQAKTPILIGGNILEKMSEFKDTTGADLVTSDVDTALRFCGLLAKPDTAQPLEGAE
jgi:methylmalonyl-CoA mutase cobalamin-binding subunit